MTREEAIEILEDLDGYFSDNQGRDYDEAFRMAIEALTADAVKVAYICDGRKCDADCSDCFRTLDIEHARDFKRIGDTYYQQQSSDAEQTEYKLPGYDEIMEKLNELTLKGGDHE